MDIFEIKDILRTRIDIAIDNKNYTEETFLKELNNVCDEVIKYRLNQIEKGV